MDAQPFHAMPRPGLTHPYVPVRQAASVMMLREAAGKLEVFIQHRATTMDFAAGVVVFPGGRTDPEDAQYRFDPNAQPVVVNHARGWQKTSLGSVNRDEALTNAAMMLRTGVREVEEETGVDLAPQIMRPWANLITPVGYPKRFDTFFYVATPDDDVMPENITTEATAAEWLPIETILADDEAKRIALMRPTKFLLVDILEYGSIDELSHRDRVVSPLRGM